MVSKKLERHLQDLPRTIKHQERRIKNLKRRPSGLRKRDAQQQELLDTNIRILAFVRERFGGRDDLTS